MLNKILRPLQILLRLRERALSSAGCRFARADRGFLGLDQRFVGIRLDLHQEVALLHRHPVDHRQFDDFAGDLRRNLHLHLRLNLAGRGNRLQDRLANRLLGRDRDRFLPFPQDRRDDNPDQKEDSENGIPPCAKGPLLLLLLGGASVVAT